MGTSGTIIQFKETRSMIATIAHALLVFICIGVIWKYLPTEFYRPIVVPKQPNNLNLEPPSEEDIYSNSIFGKAAFTCMLLATLVWRLPQEFQEVTYWTLPILWLTISALVTGRERTQGLESGKAPIQCTPPPIQVTGQLRAVKPHSLVPEESVESEQQPRG